jgi:hypothetical protein
MSDPLCGRRAVPNMSHRLCGRKETKNGRSDPYADGTGKKSSVHKCQNLAILDRTLLSISSKRRRLSTHVKPNVEESDIVIVGGGPAGLALASALGSYSLPRLQSMILRRDRISSVSEKKHEDYSDRGWRFGYNQSLESGAGFFLKSRQFAHKCLANISTRYV